MSSQTMNTFTFPNNCFSALIKRRNQIKDQFGVWMKFPKGNEFKHGNYQTMILEGDSNIRETKQYLNIVIEKTLDFKRRNKEKRKNMTKLPKQEEKKQEEISKRVNMFSALEMGDSEEETEETPVETKVSTCWGDMI
tara:strand:- start:383 stop:793 length:411 start_codon:yes stop_codon:yes gene_type:complete